MEASVLQGYYYCIVFDGHLTEHNKEQFIVHVDVALILPGWELNLNVV